MHLPLDDGSAEDFESTPRCPLCRGPSDHCGPCPKCRQQAPVPHKHLFDALASARRSGKTMREKLDGLLTSTNRHGDLQVIRSMAAQIITDTDTMIAGEKRTKEEKQAKQ